MSKHYLLSILFFLMSFSPAMAEEIRHLRFGIDYSWERPTTTVRTFRPILDEIEADTQSGKIYPVKIDIKIYPNPEDVLQAFIQGDLDIIRVDPMVYELFLASGLAVKALGIESNETAEGGILVLFSPSYVGINHVSDLKGQKVLFGQKATYAGEYLPRWLLMKNLVLEESLGAVLYNQDKKDVEEKLRQSEIVAGFLPQEMYWKLVESGLPLKKLATYPLLSPVWIVSPKIGDGLTRALQRPLLQNLTHASLQKVHHDRFLKMPARGYPEMRDIISTFRLKIDHPPTEHNAEEDKTPHETTEH